MDRQGLPSGIKGAKAGHRQKWVTGNAEQLSVGQPTGDQERVSAGPLMRTYMQVLAGLLTGNLTRMVTALGR